MEDTKPIPPKDATTNLDADANANANADGDDDSDEMSVNIKIQMNSPTPSCAGLLGSEDMIMNLAMEESLDALLNSPTPKKSTLTQTQTQSQSQSQIIHSQPQPQSPSRSRSASAASSLHSGSQNQYNIMNAVFMEVQENAKIPNTYHIPLRRDGNLYAGTAGTGVNANTNANSNANSNGIHQAVTAGNVFMDEIMRLDEADFALTENFLGSDYRVSKAAAYSNAGALLSSIGTKVSLMDDTDADRHDENNNNNAATLATAEKNTASEAPAVAPSNMDAGGNASIDVAPTMATTTTTTTTPSKVVTSSRPYAYGRPVPLPIPTKVKNRVSPPRSEANTNTVLPPSTSTSSIKVPQIVTSATLAPAPTSASAVVQAAAAAAAIAASNHRKRQASLAAAVAVSDASIMQPAIGGGAAGTGKRSITLSRIPQIGNTNTTKRTIVHHHPPTLSSVRPSSTTIRTTTRKIMTPTKPTPSLLEATKKRSQFGFGVNHTVPSVPLPPPPVQVKVQVPPVKSRQTINGKQFAPQRKVPGTVTVPLSLVKTNHIGAGRKRATPVSSSSISNASTSAGTKSSTTEGASYERKKQRAKDARVKLNESIERLSVAINLAGTQSKERIKTHKGWSSPPSIPSSGGVGVSVGVVTSGASVGPAGSIYHSGTKNHPNQVSAVAIMEEVSKTADEAKKWERPSFVGTAASMIQHLNSECEALMRELVQLKKERAHWKEQAEANLGTGVGVELGVGGDCIRRAMSRSEVMSHSVSDSGSFDDTCTDRSRLGKRQNEFLDESTGKRRKINVIQVMDIYGILPYERVVTMVGSFLDPRSVLNAMSVSRSWQCRLACMKGDIVWSHLCVKRFGAIHVREWQDKHCEEEQERMTSAVNPYEDGARNMNMMMSLYQRMNEANMKPKCHYEGTLHLGGGKIDNVVCAWVSMTERSNGETRRSVLAINGSDVQYSSLPIVELRILVQNVGVADGYVCIPDQIISVDASTKRRGEEMFEVTSDSRFTKKLINLDGSPRQSSTASASTSGVRNLAELGLYESTVIHTFIHAKACPTTSKFRARAKYVKVLVNVRGTTLPLVVPTNC